jgi:cytohesin
MKNKTRYTLVMMFILLNTASFAASFECGKARTQIEKNICADATLSKLDDELNAEYQSSQKDPTLAASIKQGQKHWLKERNGCTDNDCVKLAYQARLQAISNQLSSQKDNALIDAVRTRDIAKVTSLLAQGANVNSSWYYDEETSETRWPDESTPFRIAIDFGDTNLAELLLAHGADINATSSIGTALYQATYYEKKEIVEFLINKGADVNAAGGLGDAPLHKAAELGNIKLVELLLKHGANVNADGYLNLTPLHHAASNRRKEVVELLIAKGADVNAHHGAGVTPFHYAAIGGDKEIMEMLIAKGADIHAREPTGLTALHRAVQSRNKEAIQLLIANNVDLDAQDGHFLTPLHWTAMVGNIDATQQLVSAGADIYATNLDEETPLQFAITTNTKEGSTPDRLAVIKFLTIQVAKSAARHAEQAEKDNGLLAAVHDKDMTAATSWLAQGANINAKQLSYTPLHEAAVSGSKEMTELLLAKGANINAVIYNGSTALHLAAYPNHQELVALLLSKRADIEARTDEGWTVLHYACAPPVFPASTTPPRIALVDLLLKNGANVNTAGKGDATPLHQAIFYKQQEIAEHLIAKGAQVNAKEITGETPLHDAVRVGSKEMINLLLTKGADVNALSQSGTPLHTAAYFLAIGHGDAAWVQEKIAIVEFLLNRGANANLKNREGQTVLQNAISDNQPELIKLLQKHGAK